MVNHKGNRIVHNQSDTTLQAFDNSIGVFGRLGLASKVTSKSLFSLAKYTMREREEEEQGEKNIPCPQQECQRWPSGYEKRAR